MPGRQRRPQGLNTNRWRTSGQEKFGPFHHGATQERPVPELIVPDLDLQSDLPVAIDGIVPGELDRIDPLPERLVLLDAGRFLDEVLERIGGPIVMDVGSARTHGPSQMITDLLRDDTTENITKAIVSEPLQTTK